MHRQLNWPSAIIPSFVAVGYADSKAVDVQAAHETALSLDRKSPSMDIYNCFIYTAINITTLNLIVAAILN